jgi:hypothetical protein
MRNLFVIGFALLSVTLSSAQANNCLYGTWWESAAGQEFRQNAFEWTITDLHPDDDFNNDVHIRRNDGFVEGNFSFVSKSLFRGSLNWRNGDNWNGVELYFDSCSLIRTNKTWWYRRGMAAAPSTPPAPPAPQGGTPEWQIHALWCMRDGGSSGINYRNSCTHTNQYNSILSCQSHNPEALVAIRAAGPAAVNAFMEDKKPRSCAGAPIPPPQADFYVIWQYNCAYADKSGAGVCKIDQHSSLSCEDAKNAILRRAQSSDVCKQCANIRDDSKHVVGLPQPITGAGPCVGQ